MLPRWVRALKIINRINSLAENLIKIFTKLIKKMKITLPETSTFYLYSITLTLSATIVTLIITLKLYVWDITVGYEKMSSINYFFIDNHQYLMTAILILNGFSLLVPRVCLGFDFQQIFVLLIHGSISGVTVVLSLAPIYTFATEVWVHDIPQHFYSIHCWYGILTALLLIIEFLSAIVYHSLSLSQSPIVEKFKTFPIFHKNLGLAVFGLICMSVLLGISEMNSIHGEKFPNKYDLDIMLTNLTALAVTFFGLFVYYIIFSRIRLQTEMTKIKTKRLNEKLKFVDRVVEKQQKMSKKSQE